jgi:N-acetylglucosaminyldiphosphoundecaprenol N-acetyl-beta-D-mannosaminyltransferase
MIAPGHEVQAGTDAPLSAISKLVSRHSAWRNHPVIAQAKIEFLGVPLHALTMEQTLALAAEAMRSERALHHCVVNVAKLVGMGTDPDLRRDVSEADVINIDGVGVVWGVRLFGLCVPERVAGADVMERLFALCASQGFKPYLLGAEPGVLDAVLTRLHREYPALEIAGAQHGYFKPETETEVVAAINASGADCLFVAMPTPHKERFLHRYRQALKPAFVMGVGGSFDVYGGKVARAPRWLQAMGLEWAYRLAQEPRRLWRRYSRTNLAYAKLLWAAWRQHHQRIK